MTAFLPSFGKTREKLKRIVPLVAVVRFTRAMATPLGRGWLRARARGARIFQPATVTRMDRHPALFNLLVNMLAGLDAPRLLSFGCSTGEEVFTLIDYLPGAMIDAIDANPACIAQARYAVPPLLAKQIRFACADTPDAFAPDTYDAVLCLSVLRHGDLEARVPLHSTALLPFARFAMAVEALDRRVRPGGLLVLWGCNFRFADTATAAGYQALPSPGMAAQSGPFYGPDDGLLSEKSCVDFLFVKKAGSSGPTPAQ